MKQKQKLPANNHKNNHHQMAAITATYHGPLPLPEHLERYEQIVKGSAERIIKMAENEAGHRHEVENTVINSHFKERRLGQIFGFSIGIFAIGSGLIAILYGHDWAGATIGGIGVASLAAVFVLGRRYGNEDNNQLSTDISNI